MGDFDIAQLVNGIDHAFGAIVGVCCIDLHGRTLVLDLRIARDGDERDLFGLRVNTRKDDGVGTIGSVSRTAIGSQQQHVERIARDIGIGKRRKQSAGNDLAVIELGNNLAKPQTACRNACDKHAHERKQNRAADALSALALTSAL